MGDWLPRVSCICLTYGRTERLQEAIAFFLGQDYRGDKELIVVNDLAAQELILDHPEIRIFNLPERFSCLGDKRDFAIARSTGEVLVTWDDDDGYLPAHIAQCVRMLDGHDYAKPDKSLSWGGARTIERLGGGAMAQVVFTRELYDRAGGYGKESYGEDMELSARMLRLPDVRANFPCIEDRDITFLYRWGHGQYHLSAYGAGTKDGGGYHGVALSVQEGIRAGRIRTGLIRLVPGLAHDYALIARAFLRSLVTRDSPAVPIRDVDAPVLERLFDRDLPPPWSLSMWVCKRPAPLPEPVALFDSEQHSIRLSQFRDLAKFGVTRYHNRDHVFDFRPRTDELTHLALVARPRTVSLFVDGQPAGSLPESLGFPRQVTDTRSLVAYSIFTGALPRDEIARLARRPPRSRRVDRRIRLKFTTNWTGDADFTRYLVKLTKGDFAWNGLEMVAEDEDYTVVVNHPRSDLGLDPARVIHLRMEPECVRRGWGRWSEPDGSAAHIVFDERNSLEWHLSLDYRTLSSCHPEKSRTLSAVVSSCYWMDGHRLRLDFVRDHLDKLPYFDHFGRGDHAHASFRGQVANKEDGLFPYKYTFAAENCFEPGYFTEKLVDNVLSECLAFYWGCPDVERWIDPACFVRLDLREPEQALAIVERTIEAGEWERRIDLIRREKAKILDQLQIFPTLERLIQARRG